MPILGTTIEVLRTTVVLASTLVALCLHTGCNRGSMEATVNGTVTLDGTAIGPGTVVFAPEGKDMKPATGSIETDGTYSLMTSREHGLATGTYKVAVSVREMPQNVKRGDRPPLGKSLIPEKYEESSTSGLEYVVESGGNTINIELKRN